MMFELIYGAKIKVAFLDKPQYVQRLLQARKDHLLNLDDEVALIPGADWLISTCRFIVIRVTGYEQLIFPTICRLD